MLLVYGGIFLLFLLWQKLKGFQNRRKIFCFFAVLVLFLISAMKEITANGDLRGYANAYSTLPFRSYASLYTEWRADELKDFGFYAFGKFFADLDIPVEVWMGCIALIFACGCGAFFCRYSEDCFLSILIVMTLGYYSFTLSGLRQTVALSVIFLAYHFLLKKKPVHFILSVLVAFLFHSSALIFLPAYWIAKLKIGKKQLVIIVIALLAAVFFPGLLRNIISSVAWNDSLAGYAERDAFLSWSGYVIQLFVLVFCLFFRKSMIYRDDEEREKIDALLNCMVIGLCLQGFSGVVAEMFRVSYYYSIGCLIAVPNVIAANYSGKNRQIMYAGVGVALVAYLLWSGAYRDLIFFWQVSI